MSGLSIETDTETGVSNLLRPSEAFEVPGSEPRRGVDIGVSSSELAGGSIGK